MFNNVAFDVVIGLVLIYLLYSLIVTIVGEMLSTWMGLRPRVLRLAVEKMLNDRYDNSGLWEFIQRFFLKEFKEFKHSFAGKFYDQPSIKYLSSKAGEGTTFFSQTKASYFTADNFADTLIQLLREKAAGNDDIEKINFCLRFNTQHIQPETLMNLRRIFSDSGKDINIFKNKLNIWFTETNDRATGWYKRKLQLILFWMGFIIAVAFNVDSIRIARFLSKDKEARKQLANMGVELTKDSVRYKDFINSKRDSIHSKTILDSGLSHISKDIEEANLILGLGWGLDTLKKNETYKIAKNRDSVSYELIREYADTLKWLGDSFGSWYQKTLSVKSSLDSVKQKVKFQSMLLSPEFTDVAKDSLEKIKTSLALNKKKAFNDSIIYYDDSQLLLKYRDSINGIQKRIKALTGNKFSIIDSLDSTSNALTFVIHGQRPYSRKEKLYYIFRQLPNSLLGFIITALMLSLGAPFWFDLLKKLVSLRGAGVKPEEKKPLPDSEKSTGNLIKVIPPVPNTTIMGDLMDQAIQLYGADIKSIPGVKSIFKLNGALQINVADDVTQAVVLDKYPAIMVNSIPVTFTIVITGTPRPHLALQAGQIINASRSDVFGAQGCIVEETETKTRHVLSCWHVMKGNIDYDHDDTMTTILDFHRVNLASRWAGGISGTFDFGLAELFSERKDENNATLFQNVNIKKSYYRQLSNADINNQIDIKFFDSVNPANEPRQGKICTETDSVEIHYEDKIRILSDLLVLTNQAKNGAISRPGNSGSIVFDNEGFAIGMIIGGDLAYTYAVKLSNIFSIHTEMRILNQ